MAKSAKHIVYIKWGASFGRIIGLDPATMRPTPYEFETTGEANAFRWGLSEAIECSDFMETDETGEPLE